MQPNTNTDPNALVVINAEAIGTSKTTPSLEKLIAKHERVYAEWERYLELRAPVERAHFNWKKTRGPELVYITRARAMDAMLFEREKGAHEISEVYAKVYDRLKEIVEPKAIEKVSDDIHVEYEAALVRWNAAHDKLLGEQREFHEIAGKEEQLCHEACDLEREVLAYPVTTVDEMKVKLAWIEKHLEGLCSGEETIDVLVDNLIDFARIASPLS